MVTSYDKISRQLSGDVLCRRLELKLCFCHVLSRIRPKNSKTSLSNKHLVFRLLVGRKLGARAKNPTEMDDGGANQNAKKLFHFPERLPR